jgi:hypothetical protein
MEIDMQPPLLDQMKIMISSQRLRQLPVNDENATISGLTKTQATDNATNHANLHQDLIDSVSRWKGWPKVEYRRHLFREYKVKGVSMVPYGSFPIWVFGNPTEFQKEQYIKEGLIDSKKNRLERRHENNFIHTDNCNLEREQIIVDNRRCLPDVWGLSEHFSKDILGYDPYRDEEQTLFTNASMEIIEVNQDILVHPFDAVTVQNDLWAYLISQDGMQHLYDIRAQKAEATTNMTFAGTSIVLDFGRKGLIKIYPKTHHGLRMEARLLGKQHIKPMMGNKRLDGLQTLINDHAVPLMNQARIPELLREQKPPRNITPLVLDHTITDPVLLHMIKKLIEHKYLLKKEIHPMFRRHGKKHFLKAERHGKDWHYVLHPNLYGGAY